MSTDDINKTVIRPMHDSYITLVNEDYHLISHDCESPGSLIPAFIKHFTLLSIFDKTLSETIEVRTYTFNKLYDYFDENGIFYCSGNLVDSRIYKLGDIAAEMLGDQGLDALSARKIHKFNMARLSIKIKDKMPTVNDKFPVKLFLEEKMKKMVDLENYLWHVIDHVDQLRDDLKEFGCPKTIKKKASKAYNLLTDIGSYFDEIGDD